MKRFFCVVVAFLFTAISIQAQKIDARLTALLSSSNRVMSANKASRSMEMDTAAVKSEINVNFHSDCMVKSFSVIVMLKDGVVCPTERLQMLGVKIRDVIGRMLILTVPAESLLTLDDVDGNCYNTLVQRVSKNTKGIVIYKGKLYVNP